MSKSRSDQIVEARRTILEGLDIGRRIPMLGRRVYSLVRSLLESTYDEQVFEKDVIYLEECGFLRINENLSGRRTDELRRDDARWYLKVYWELTAAGLDVAQGIVRDSRLE